MCELFGHERLRSIGEYSGLWSCVGYDGLSIAFDVPLTCLDKLSNEQSQDLMHLLHHLTIPLDGELRSQVQKAANAREMERLDVLKELSTKIQR